jgi:3-isopropylmalate dehydrogenase
MILSAAMMLDWLGMRHGDAALIDGARAIEKAVELAFANGQIRPFEFGGTSGTAQVLQSVMSHLQVPRAAGAAA